MREILKDAGCEGTEIKRLLETVEQPKQFLALLARHRAALLDEVHRGEKKIDCLDYLIYRMKKEQNR